MILDTKRIKTKRIKDCLTAKFAQYYAKAQNVPQALPVKGEELMEPLVVAGNLTDLIESSAEFSAFCRRQPTAVLGVIEAHKDEIAMMNVDLLARCADGRILVIQAKTSQELAAVDINEVFSKLAGAFSCTFVISARHVSADKIAVAFGDGLTGETNLSRIGVNANNLLLRTLRASADGDSIEVETIAGKTVDIDSSAVRALFDRKHAAELRDKNKSVRLDVGQRLRAARESKQMSQVALAEASGLAQEVISRIENGKQEPRYGTLAKMASGLNLSVEELLAGS